MSFEREEGARFEFSEINATLTTVRRAELSGRCQHFSFFPIMNWKEECARSREIVDEKLGWEWCALFRLQLGMIQLLYTQNKIL